MSRHTFGDVETAVKAWLSATPSVATLLTRPDTGKSIYLAMPSAAPNPAAIITRVGGAPRATELPTDVARISIDCFGRTRAEAHALAAAIAAAYDDLSYSGPYVAADGTRLMNAEVVGLLWLPDPATDTARYVIDALVYALNPS